MTIKNLGDFLAKLQGVQPGSGGRYTALCPAHEDRHQSLSVWLDGQSILIKCHSGCAAQNIVAALDLDMKDLFLYKENKKASPREMVAAYPYADAHGNLLFEVVRYKPKTFRQRRPDGKGNYIWNLQGIEPVLYHLPEVLEAVRVHRVVWVVEGEKDADLLRAWDLAATTSPMGAGKWRESYSQSLRGTDVVVIPDNDESGRKHASSICHSLLNKADSIRYLVLEGQEVKDVANWIEAGGTKDQLVRLIRELPEWEPGQDERPLPEICMSDLRLRDATQATMNALLAANAPPTIFIRSRQVVRVGTDEHALPVIEELRESSFRGCLERVANFTRIGVKGQVITMLPPIEVVRDILSLGKWPFPPLQGITETPAIRPDGSILSEPGYDPVTRLYYSPAPSLSIPTIPEHPTREDAAEAMKVLEEVICDFPFENEASRANAVAAIMTPVLRPLIRGLVPMALFDKPQAGTGASLLADVVSLIATGRASAMLTAPKEDDEAWRKSITSLLMLGRSVVTIDNIEGRLSSASLSSVLTSNSWQDRVLGRSEMIVLPHRITWIGTGNNIRLAGDISRRCYWIRMDAKEARPWQRKGFTHPHLIEWVTENRGKIIAAVLTIARAWILQGKPSANLNAVMGSFEDWVEIIGNIMGMTGRTAFLSNLEQMYEIADDETPHWEAFISSWHEILGSKFVTVKELNDSLKTVPALADNLPLDFSDSLNDKGFTRKLGRALARRSGVRYPNNFIIERGKDFKRALTWRVSIYKQGELGELFSPGAHKQGELGELFSPGEQGNSIIGKKQGEFCVVETHHDFEAKVSYGELPSPILPQEKKDIRNNNIYIGGAGKNSPQHETHLLENNPLEGNLARLNIPLEKVETVWLANGSPTVFLVRGRTFDNPVSFLTHQNLTDAEVEDLAAWLDQNEVKF